MPSLLRTKEILIIINQYHNYAPLVIYFSISVDQMGWEKFILAQCFKGFLCMILEKNMLEQVHLWQQEHEAWLVDIIEIIVFMYNITK